MAVDTNMANPTQILDGFVGALRNLTTDNNYQLVADVFGEAMRLREQNSRISIAQREMLEEYRSFRNELETDKAAILDAKHKLETELADKIVEIDGLTVDKARLEEELAASQARANELDETRERLEAELADATARIQDLEEKKAALEAEAEVMRAQIDDLEREKQRLDEELTSAKNQIEELEAEAERRSEEIASLKATVEEQSGSIDSLRHNLSDAESRAAESGAAVVALEEELALIRSDLQVRSARLAELEGYRFNLLAEPEDAYVSILDTIWTSIFELVESHMRIDLDDLVLSDASCWTNLRTSSYLKRPTTQLPIPRSNSGPAKAMRIAAVLAVLSRALHRYIFRPAYLLDGGDAAELSSSSGVDNLDPDASELSQLLRDVDRDDPGREMHLRATILAALPADRTRFVVKKRVQAVVRDVSWVVQHLLSALTLNSFVEGLQAACTLACEQWRRIQAARTKIEAYFGPPYDDFDWQILPLAEFDDHNDANPVVPADGPVNGFGYGYGRSIPPTPGHATPRVVEEEDEPVADVLPAASEEEPVVAAPVEAEVEEAAPVDVPAEPKPEPMPEPEPEVEVEQPQKKKKKGKKGKKNARSEPEAEPEPQPEPEPEALPQPEEPEPVVNDVALGEDVPPLDLNGPETEIEVLQEGGSTEDAAQQQQQNEILATPVNLDTRADNNDDDEDKSDGGAVTSTEEIDLEPDNILLVVWPSMCTVENGDLASITQGLVIAKTQAQSAFREVAKTRTRPVKGGDGSLSFGGGIGGSGGGSGYPGYGFLGKSAMKKARTMSIPSYTAGSPAAGPQRIPMASSGGGGGGGGVSINGHHPNANGASISSAASFLDGGANAVETVG